MFKRNSPTVIHFHMRNLSCKDLTLPGSHIIVYRTIDDGEQVRIPANVTHLGHGQYKFAAKAEDLNGDCIGFLFTNPTAMSLHYDIHTTKKLLNEINLVSLKSLIMALPTKIQNILMPVVIDKEEKKVNGKI